MQGAPAGPFAGAQAPATCDVRGAAPPVHPSALPVFLSTEAQGFLARGLRPLCAPPRTPGDFTGLVAPASTCRRSALHPGDFPVAGKVTKGAPRAAPFGIPLYVVTALFALASHRAGLPSATNPDRFATLNLWENRPLFLPKLYRGSHLQLSIRGAAGLPPRMLEGLSYRNQYRPGHKAGIGVLLCVEVQGPGGPWRIFAYFLYARK